MEVEHLLVPVRVIDGLAEVIVTGRSPTGERIGIAFTTSSGLRSAMGTARAWDTMSLASLRRLLAPLGIESVCVDPDLVTAPERGCGGAGTFATSASSYGGGTAA